MKFNTPLPQPLPKECLKAAKIFKSFVDSGNHGLDGVIPRSVLENARGFAIFTIFKAGFLFSARAGSGVVIAKLEDGTWSAPSAIGSAGLGVGGQAGAEMTDFLVVLNSQSAVRSFMSAGSLTLGGNLSVAVGPLGRNGEAIGSVNTSGKLAAMYSYSKTRGLFGGVSIEGSVIVERQDANAQAYQADVTVKQLLSGAIPPPEWAQPLIKTLDACTGLPGNRRWVKELNGQHTPKDYIFGGVESPSNENGPSSRPGSVGPGTPGSLRKKKEKSASISFPPVNWGRRKSSGSYFFNDTPDASGSTPAQEDRPSPRMGGAPKPATGYFDTQFDSDFGVDDTLSHHPPLQTRKMPESIDRERRDRDRDRDRDAWDTGSPFRDMQSGPSKPVPLDATSHRRAFSAYAPSPARQPSASNNPFDNYVPSKPDGFDEDQDFYGGPPVPKITAKPELAKPLLPHEGVARAIALYTFQAVQEGDLSFEKGQVITVTEMSDDTNTWWHGKVDGRKGIFPANFVEVV